MSEQYNYLNGNILSRHSTLESCCQNGLVSLVKEMLSKHKDMDVCFNEGVYFYFALDLDHKHECLEILNLLLNYAEETNTDKRKLVEAINDAKTSVRRKIPKAANVILDKYLLQL